MLIQKRAREFRRIFSQVGKEKGKKVRERSETVSYIKEKKKGEEKSISKGSD